MAGSPESFVLAVDEIPPDNGGIAQITRTYLQKNPWKMINSYIGCFKS